MSDNEDEEVLPDIVEEEDDEEALLSVEDEDDMIPAYNRDE